MSIKPVMSMFATELDCLRSRDKWYFAENADLSQRLEDAKKDAERYRWLQDQHEGVELNGLDADGVMLPASVRAVAFTVFMPDKWGHESLVPVPIGDLDETIDAAISASKPAGGA